jgi:hypothetical protein
MPANLTTSMPTWLPAAAAVITIAVRRLRERHDSPRSPEDVDARIGAVQTAGWLGLCALHLCHTGTVGQLPGGPVDNSITVHVIRFYLPAMGLIAMLAAWLISRFVRPVLMRAIGVLAVAALFSFQSMATSNGLGGSGRIDGGSGGTGEPPSGATGAGPGGPPPPSVSLGTMSSGRSGTRPTTLVG